MFKYAFLGILSCASLCANPEQVIESQYPTSTESVRTTSPATDKVKVEKEDTTRNFNKRLIPYVKLGPNVINVGSPVFVSPNIGLGIRSETYEGAVDVSFSYSMAKMGRDIIAYQAIFPKIVYHRFLCPYASNSFYYGGGASWAEIRNKAQGVKFSGLMGNVSVGYEMGRNSSIRQMIQLDVDQPLLAYRLEQSLPMPSVQASYSLGF